MLLDTTGPLAAGALPALHHAPTTARPLMKALALKPRTRPGPAEARRWFGDYDQDADGRPFVAVVERSAGAVCAAIWYQPAWSDVEASAPQKV